VYKNQYLNQFQGYLEEGILFILTASEATKSYHMRQKTQEVLFAIFELSPLTYNATKIAKANRFY